MQLIPKEPGVLACLHIPYLIQVGIYPLLLLQGKSKGLPHCRKSEGSEISSSFPFWIIAYPVAHFCFIHIGSGDHRAYDPLFLNLLQHIPEFPATYRIHTGGGFIQDQISEVCESGRTGKCQFLLHSPGEFSCQSFLKRCNLLIDITDQVIVLLHVGSKTLA